MTYKFKGRDGYYLKKGEQGNRWHKREDKRSKDNGGKVSESVAELNNPKHQFNNQERYEIARSLIPNNKQASFSMTKAELALDVPPDEFYGHGNRLILPSHELVYVNSDKFADKDYGAAHTHSPDATNAPDVLYHGTRFAFDEFNDHPELRPASTGHWNNIFGNYFTPTYAISEMYSDKEAAEKHDRPHDVDISEAPHSIVIQSMINAKHPIVSKGEETIDKVMMSRLFMHDLDDIERAELENFDSGYQGIFDKIDDLDGLPDYIKERELAKFIAQQKVNYDARGRLYRPMPITPHLIADALVSEIGSDEAEQREIDRKVYHKKLQLGARFKSFLQGKGFDSFIWSDPYMGLSAAPFSARQITVLKPETRFSSFDIINKNIEGDDVPQLSKKYLGDYRRYHDEYLKISHDLLEGINEGRDSLKTKISGRFKTLDQTLKIARLSLGYGTKNDNNDLDRDIDHIYDQINK